MVQKTQIATIPTPEGSVRIHYIDSTPYSTQMGTILLIHGFPQTNYQYRHVIAPLTKAGYRLIVPDYRGAGRSSKPTRNERSQYTKSRMAADLYHLVTEELGIKQKIHVVGHDIGGMVAYAYVSRYSSSVASVIWGECPLPGTSAYTQDLGTKEQWHFIFHCVPDLPETLVAGREEAYLTHFYDKQMYNSAAMTTEDIAVYVEAFRRPGAMRSGFEVYRSFEDDKEENIEWLKEHGKCRVPTLLLSGDRSRHAAVAETMGNEVFETVEVAQIKDSSHYIAEENPEDFVEKVLSFIRKHETEDT